jgi:hypothetical protein
MARFYTIMTALVVAALTAEHRSLAELVNTERDQLKGELADLFRRYNSFSSLASDQGDAIEVISTGLFEPDFVQFDLLEAVEDGAKLGTTAWICTLGLRKSTDPDAQLLAVAVEELFVIVFGRSLSVRTPVLSLRGRRASAHSCTAARCGTIFCKEFLKAPAFSSLGETVQRQPTGTKKRLGVFFRLSPRPSPSTARPYVFLGASFDR